ncbi:hypothetical protein BH11VER1_BH11VER1_24730 [soil metagenome]
MKRLVALSLLCLTGSAFSQTVAEPETPDTWVVRTFQFPSDFLMPSQADETPAEINSSTPASVIVEAIKQDSANFANPSDSTLLRGHTLPVGSAMLFDKKTNTITLRTTAQEMEQMQMWVDSWSEQLPHNILYTLHLIEADDATLRQAAREAFPLFNHAAVWKRLQDLNPQSQIKHLNTLRLETHSGHKARVESTRQIMTPTDFTLDEKGRTTWETPAISTGTSFEVDPVLGLDGVTIYNDFSFEYHYVPPTSRNEKVNYSAVNAPFVIPVVDLHRVKVSTSCISESGNIKLIALWKPEGAPGFEGRDRMQAAFLQTEVVKLYFTSPNKDLEKIFLTHVDQAVPLPKVSSAKIQTPPGMQTKSYAVPVDLLDLGSQKDDKALDPFQANNGLSATDLLMQQGIPFPAGAAALFQKSVKKLTVTNTPPNLDQVEAFLDSIHYCPPHNIVFTLHLIQADGTIMRQIAADNSASSDQTEALASLEKLISDGNAQSLQVLRLETRSGQSVTTEVGPAWMMLDSVKADEKGKQTFHHTSHPLGTQFTVDAVLGPDGYTMDLELALEHHFAPPSTRSADPEKPQGILQPAIDFHFAKTSTFITTSTGLTKLVGLWRPEGTVEFENKDFMQAAFLTATIVGPETDKKR